MNASETKEALLAIAEAVIAAEPELTDADRAIGDGDHGIGMKRGFLAVAEKLMAADPASPSAALKDCGMAIMAKTGGAAGAVFGTFFRAGAEAVKERQELTGTDLRAFLAAGQEAVMKRGGAAEGDKTMLDALAEAGRSVGAEDLPTALAQAAEGARRGAEATRAMTARFGKAKTLGQRAVGHPDPGALTMATILEAWRDSISS